MSKHPPSDEYDEDVRAWLAPLGGEAAADREFLRGLRERSADEFAKAGTVEQEAAPITLPPRRERRDAAPGRSRALIAAAACLAAVALWLAGGALSSADSLTLGDVLRRAGAAKTLRLEFRRGEGEQAEVLVGDAGRVRWDEAPGEYAIARGRQLWRIDEAANTAAREASPWSGGDGIDLVALLESGGKFHLDGVDRWLNSEPSGRGEYLGVPCHVYEQRLPAAGGPIRLAAYADVERGELQGLVAWRADAPVGPPLAELRLVARDLPVDEAKFVVAESLTEDGRIGKVLDVQGLAALQPPLASRWTPVCGPVVLKPGDWIRTETRGANAVRVALSSQAELTLGPGGLLELISPTRVRVHSGELQAKIASTAASALTVLGRGDASEMVAVGGEALFRRRDADAELSALNGKPRWLAGFEGTTSDESLGSLIATVDGRSVPLSVGYHKVGVDIRDQIARTVIEESFVNHTAGRLEGVFYFPLPADASISGFGMWIDGELVEADVVEKQRAREIYETILRERRDPGLLEWTSGNLFKARVFPIEPHSEKRVKLVYTQVLPLRDNRYVYSYGLRSELLRTRPLRELAIDVRVSSELPLRRVACPTHDVRTEQTAHAAQVQFAAQEYAPTRDFEVVCEIDGRQSDVVAIPHQRGEDGYFLVQLTPPAPAGMWRRDTLGEGEPLELLLVCDTSGSMDSESRRLQREFVAAVLGSLGPEDRFNLAACDVDCRWAFNGDANGEVASATRERTEQALHFLDARRSLGWTDLDRTFAAALERAGDKTQVIYIGDGVPSAGDADPQALAARLRRLCDANPRGAFHAVGVGNLYDAVVLKAIAGLGGGSLRHIGGQQTPPRLALELLQELTAPGLRDLRVEFSGMQVAAVYPERLPNLPAGAQQILVGRYLPQKAAQTGELIVTGRRGEETVRYATRVEFPAARSLQMNPPAPSPSVGRALPSSGSLPLVGRVGEGEQPSTVAGGDRAQGGSPSPHRVTPPLTPPHSWEGDGEAETNSFIPRLWARSHLDHLLAQGPSQAIQDEIIALSEEFHIITPYTSLLVLETDADRERFGVTRRFAMRDGERFFADGRDNANYELTQQQMREAGNWRSGLRQQILAEFAGLGRVPWALEQSAEPYFSRSGRWSGEGRSTSFSLELVREEQLVLGVPVTIVGDHVLPMSGPVGGRFGGGGGFAGEYGGIAGNGRALWDFDFVPVNSTLSVDDSGSMLLGGVKRLYANDELRALNGVVDERNFNWNRGGFADYTVELDLPQRQSSFAAGQEFFMNGPMSGEMLGKEMYAGRRAQRTPSLMGFALSEPIGLRGYLSDRFNVNAAKPWPSSDQFTNLLDQVVPGLPAPALGTGDAKPQAAGWTPEAVEIAESLLRVSALREVDGGVEVRRVSESLDPRWDRVAGRAEQLELYSPTAWLTRPLGDGVHTVVQWCNADGRGAFSRAFELGRVRKSTAAERREIPLELYDDSLASLAEIYATWNARIERPAGRAVLVLTPKNDAQTEMRLTIDAERHVLVERQQLAGGKVVATTTLEDFIEVGGTWWAQRIVTRDAADAVTSRVTQSVTLLDADKFAARLAEEIPSRAVGRGSPTPPTPAPALLIRFPLPRLQEAKEAVAGGSAGVEAQLVMLLDVAARQQWDEAFARLEAIEALAPQAPEDAQGSPDQAWSGLTWIRLALEQAARRNAAALERITAEAQRLADAGRNDRLHLANHLLNVAGGIVDGNEQLRLIDALRPVFAAQPELVGGVAQWQGRRVGLLQSLGRTEERLPLHRELAAATPWDAGRQVAYANDLSDAGRRDDAYAWLQQELERNPRRAEGDKDQLVFAYADLLYWEGRYAAAADFLAQRVEQRPENQEVYQRYLGALVFADRVPRAEELADPWLRIGEADAAGKLAPSDLARLQAAVSYALGDRHRISVDRPEERWLPALAAVARRFATHEHHPYVAARILGHGRFSDSDLADAVRRDLFERLKAEAAELSPAQLSALIGWAMGGPPETTADDWRPIAATIRRRWEQAADPQEKDALGQPLVTIYSNRFADDEYLPFLRSSVAAAAKEYRTGYVAQLFEALLARPWSDALEAEAFSLLPALSDAAEPVDRLAVQLPALHRLVDRMIQARLEHDRQELQANGHPEKLTRTDLAAKEAEFLKRAREGVAERLGMPLEGPNEGLAKWLRIERLTLDVQLERAPGDVAVACWEILGEAPPAITPGAAQALPASAGDVREDAEDTVDQAAFEREVRTALLEGVYRSRALALVSYLAVRRDASPDAVDRLLKFIDAGIAHGGDAAAPWRGFKYQLLVALDRPDDLLRELRRWIADSGPVSPWRAPLGRLLAERGGLADAIGVFEAVRANDALSPQDLAALAKWYLAVDRRADYERAMVDAYMNVEEYTLRQMISGYLSPWQRTDVPLPTELDEHVLLVFEALFRKATSPGDYAWLLRDFYTACRDFRLLRMVPDAVLGRTQQQVYPFLESLNSNLLVEVRDEAVADEILGRVSELRERELTPLDARALDLLEAMIERKTAEVLNQPGPHADAAVAALRRAFRAEWAEGERMQMARLLSQFGKIAAPALAVEQIRQLRELHVQSEAGSLERLQVAGWLGHALFWSYGPQNEALAVMETAVGEFDRARDGVWPAGSTEPLETYVTLLENRSRYAEGEALLMRLAAKPDTYDMTKWFTERLDRLYLAALNGDGQTSLGRGAELYRNLVEHIDAELDTDNQSFRYQAVNRLLEVFANAKNKPALAETVKQDLRRFAFERLPGVLRRQMSNYEHLVENTADKLHDIVGARDGLEFLIERLEAYPPWMEMTWDNAWRRNGYRLAQWREEVGDGLGDLEPRLLRLALAELRRDLTTRNGNNRYLYHDDYGHFWEAKRGAFAATARDVLAERRTSGRAVKHIADYLYNGLNLHGEAIQALFVVHRAEQLDEAGQQQLVQYLHWTDRYGESIALLEPLIELRPDNISYRAQLLKAYFYAERPAQLHELLAATDKHFRAGGRWNESVMEELGYACLVTQLHQQAVGYYDEAIAVIQRQQPAGGVGGDALSRCYGRLAEAWSALGETEQAVDAAAGAVVSWGPRQDQRQGALDALRRVLTGATDLDGYAVTLDRKAEDAGEDSPLLRKMMGEVLLEKNRPADAERHLRASVALEPTDLAAHEALLKCLDAQEKNDAAVAALLAMIDLDRRNLERLKGFADRLARSEEDAERAATMLVEAGPQEAENHFALAEWRQRQDRWAEAIDQWQHVARLRTREPDGLVKLATAQVRERRWAEAEETVKKLSATTWPARFGELPAQILQLQQQIAAGKD